MKKFLFTTFIFSLILLVSSCKIKEKLFTSETKVIDSVKVISEQIKAPLLKDVLYIKDICDTTTGKAKEVQKIYIIDNDSIELLIDKNNDLYFSINQKSKIISKKDSLIKKLQKELKEKSETIIYKNRYDLLIWSTILALILGIVIGVTKAWRLIL